MKRFQLFFTFILTIAIVIFLSGCKKTDLGKQSQLTQNQQSSQNQTSQIKASFAIFTDNTFRAFTASMYHNQSEDIFITSELPNIITVNKNQATWGEFFNSLPMKLTNECLTTGTGEVLCTTRAKTLKFYVNGIQVEDFTSKIIEDGDKALVSYGSENETQIQAQLQQIPAP